MKRNRIEDLSPWGQRCIKHLRRATGSQTLQNYLGIMLRLESYLQEKQLLTQPGTPVAHPGGISKEGWNFAAHRLDSDWLLDWFDDHAHGAARTINQRLVVLGHYLDNLRMRAHVAVADVKELREHAFKPIRREIEKANVRRANTPPRTAELRRALSLEPSLRMRAFVLLAAKTGARRGDLLRLDWEDIDLDALRLRFKDQGLHQKRCFFTGLIDHETAMALRLWRLEWEAHRIHGETAVFVSKAGKRPGRRATYRAIQDDMNRFAARVEKHWTIHSLRHWFTDTLRVGGMPDYMIGFLRGDKPGSTLDIYTHMESEHQQRKLREKYDAAMPSLLDAPPIFESVTDPGGSRQEGTANQEIDTSDWLPIFE